MPLTNYTPATWQNGTTAINAARLNNMETGIDAVNAEVRGESGARVLTVIGTGTAATDTANLQAAVNELGASTDYRRILRLVGSFAVNAEIVITYRGLKVVGERRHTSTRAIEGGTQIVRSGAGAIFRLGTDAGDAYTNFHYNGPQGFELHDVNLQTTGGVTALSNGLGNYLTDSYGVRDFYAGDVLLNNVQFHGFDFPFWGVESDLNTFRNIGVTYCKNGLWLGPKCDQLDIFGLYTHSNDTAVTIDGAWGANIYGWKTVNDGSTNTSAMAIKTTYLATRHINVWGPWLEHYDENPLSAAYVDIGVGNPGFDAAHVFIHNPIVMQNGPGASPRTKYLMRVGRAYNANILHPTHETANLDAYVEFVGNNVGAGVSPDVLLEAHEYQDKGAANYVNSKTAGFPFFMTRIHGQGRQELSGTNAISFRGDEATHTLHSTSGTTRYTATLTQNCVISLPATSSLKDGWKRRVARTALTPGAFTLNVGGLYTIPTNAREWVDVEYVEGNFFVSGRGAL